MYFQVHVLIGLALFALWPFTRSGARVQRADRLPVPALCRLPQPRRRGQGPSGGVDAAAPGLVTTSSLRRESAVGDASSEADSYGQCNFRGFGGCHAEWISALEVGAAGVVRPGVWGAPLRQAAQDPHGLDDRRAEWRVRLHGVRDRCLRGADPRLGMLAVAERIMLRGNRYALAAARDGVPLEPWVQPLHGCDNPVYVRVSRPVVCRDPPPWVQPRRRGAEDR